LKNNKLVLMAIFLGVLAIILGILHSQYSDPESSTPAPYIGFLAFILAIISLIVNRYVKRQNLKTGNKWIYRIVGLIILAIIIYVIIGIVGFIQCAHSADCRIFTF
jgi:CDP-diglyceride synthetase